MYCWQGEIVGSFAKRYDESQAQNITGYWIKKWISSDIQGYNYSQAAYSTPNPTYLFRLAELYLAAAEAWNEYQGPIEKVYDYIDKIPVRAGIPKVQEAWNSYGKKPDKVKKQASMRESMQQE